MYVKHRIVEVLETHDNVKIPIFGLGTWQLSGSNCEKTIETALSLGYRHIDTAAMYRNEESIGMAISKNKVDRDDIFITTKVWTSDLGYSNTLSSFQRSIKKLQTDYIDLFLIHWPGNNSNKRLQSYKKMIELRDEGQIRTIGVSNFSPSQIDEVYKEFGEYPAVNQILFNPFNYNIKTLDYCNLHNIILTAYTPLNKGSGFKKQEITKISKKYNKTPAQVVLRWFLDLGVITIPKSSNKQRLKENIDIFDFSLNDQEVDSLKNL